MAEIVLFHSALALRPFSSRWYTALVTDKGEERRGWFVLVYKLPGPFRRAFGP